MEEEKLKELEALVDDALSKGKKESLSEWMYQNKKHHYDIGILNAKAKRLGTDIVKVADSLGLSNKKLSQEEAKLINDVLNKLLDVKPIKRPNYKYYDFIKLGPR